MMAVIPNRVCIIQISYIYSVDDMYVGTFLLSIILGKCVYLHIIHLKNVINAQFAQ